MYPSFLNSFHRLLSFPNNDIVEKHAHYTWQDQSYKDFMFMFLKALEPRREAAGTIILEQLEGVNEILFIE